MRDMTVLGSIPAKDKLLYDQRLLILSLAVLVQVTFFFRETPSIKGLNTPVR